MESQEKTKFIYMGDSQCARIDETTFDYTGWERLLDRACLLLSENQKEHDTQQKGLLVMGGDVVNNISSKHEWRSFFGAFNGHKDQLTMIAANGNHVKNQSYSDKKMFSKRVKIPDNGPAGLKKRFYSYDYGCVHFMVLDSNFMGNGRPDVVAQIRGWMEHDLAANRKPVTMVVMHHPMFVIKETFNDYARASLMRQEYLPLFDQFGVDFILCGHQHIYARSREFGSRETGKKNGMIQIMGVSGTKVYHDELTDDMIASYTCAPVATVFETDGQKISLTTIDEQGNIVDSYAKAVRQKPQDDGQGQPRTAGSKGKACWQDKAFSFASDGGIRIYGDGISGIKSVGKLRLKLIRKSQYEYSILRMNEMVYETWQGYDFMKVLAASGWKQDPGKDYLLRITSKEGITRAMKLEDLLQGKCFTNLAQGQNPQQQGHEGSQLTGSKPASAILVSEEDGFRLVCGQKVPQDRNLRRWIRRLTEIEIVNSIDIKDKIW